MTSPFSILVTSDERIPDRDFYMGLEALLEDDNFEVTFLPRGGARFVEPETIRGYDAVFAIKCEITAETLTGGDELVVIGKFGSGMDAIDVEACTNHGIVVFNSPHGVRDSVAQSTVGYLIACAHRFKRFDNRIRDHGFTDRMQYMGEELFNQTLGLIGFGRIGHRLVELIEPFDMNIIVHDPYLDPADVPQNVTLESLETVLSTADFVSLHCPLTKETRGMIGEDELRLMKPSAYLINTARGGIYNDQLLANAIRENWIAGAAIDVYEDEPDVEHNPLLDLDDVLLTPHIAGVTVDSVSKAGYLLTESLNRFQAGEFPNNLVNPDVYKSTVPAEYLSPSFKG